MLALHNHEQTIIALREDMVLNQNQVFFFFLWALRGRNQPGGQGGYDGGSSNIDGRRNKN